MGQNSCLCKLAELHLFDRSDNGLCWQKILSCTQLMAAKREVLDLVFSWVFATLTSLRNVFRSKDVSSLFVLLYHIILKEPE